MAASADAASSSEASTAEGEIPCIEVSGNLAGAPAPYAHHVFRRAPGAWVSGGCSAGVRRPPNQPSHRLGKSPTAAYRLTPPRPTAALRPTLRSLQRNGPVLVTGGAGFIGGAVAEALLRRGETVVVMDEVSGRPPDGVSGGQKARSRARTRQLAQIGLHQMRLRHHLHR